MQWIQYGESRENQFSIVIYLVEPAHGRPGMQPAIYD